MKNISNVGFNEVAYQPKLKIGTINLQDNNANVIFPENYPGLIGLNPRWEKSNIFPRERMGHWGNN